MRKQLLMMVALFLLATVAFAKSEQPKPVFGKKMAATAFPEIIEMVRKEIEPGGRWEYVPAAERPKVENQLKLMETLLGDRASVEELSEDDQFKLLNAQEHLNSILLQHDGQRLICERITPTGSHRPKRVCMTLAQRRQMSEDSQREAEDVQKMSRIAPPGQ